MNDGKNFDVIVVSGTGGAGLPGIYTGGSRKPSLKSPPT